jgi:hypothetical protein
VSHKSLLIAHTGTILAPVEADGFGVRHQRRDSAGTVHHAYDLDAVGD